MFPSNSHLANLCIFLMISSTSSLNLPIKQSQEVSAEFYDLVFKNCTLIDGTGSAPLENYYLTVTSQRISSIGPESSIQTSLIKPGETIVIEANGNYMSPGFIDSHTHDDVAILSSPSHSFKARQGVTSVVTGNCGFSNYPGGDLPLVRQHLSSLLGQVEDYHFFKNFTSLSTSLSSSGIGLNVASLVGHGPIRISVMGYENREATQLEIYQMMELLDSQLRQGSIGLSLGLVYPPSAYASMKELVSLASIVASRNKVITAHVRSYEGNLLKSVSEFIEVLRQSGARGLLSHLQVAGKPYWGTMINDAIKMIEEARTLENIDIMVDMYPYLAGSSTILQLLPPSAMAGGIEELLEKLENPWYLLELEVATESGKEEGWESKIALIGWENVMVGSVVHEELKRFEGLNMTEGARLMNLREFQFLIHLVVVDFGQTNVIMFQQSGADQAQVFQYPMQMVGSDSIPREGGKPHPRGYGTFPRVIGRLVKEDKILSIEQAVRKASGLTASRFNMADRGLLKVGYMADLVLFSEEFLDQATYEQPTLSPVGVLGVWVNGVRVVENDQTIQNLPGQVVV